MTVYRFDQIADNINVRVMPNDTDLDRYVGLEHLDPESLKLRRWGSPDDVIGQKLRFWVGDIVYGRRRAYQRKLAVADFDGICSAHALVLRAKPEVCLPEFLPFFLQSELFHQRALEISVGSLSPTINWKTLAKQEFPLPPVDEQRRIADLLWAADEMIQTHNALNNSAETLFASKTNHIVEQETNNTVLLSDVARVIDCKHRTPKYFDEGVPIVSPGNIRWGALNLSECKRTSYEEYRDLMNHCSVEPWDLVIGRNQSIGNASYVVDTEFAIGQDTVLIQATDIDKKFLYLLFQSRYIQNQIAQLSRGSTFKRINLENIRKLQVPLPDTETQKQAAQFVEQTEEVKRQLQNKELANNNLKKSLLNKMLGS